MIQLKIDHMKTNFYKYIIIALLFIPFTSCQEDDVLPPQSEAQFTASATNVKINEVIQFTNNSQNATAYLWSFGDGTTSREVSPKKSYQSSDVFLVSLVSTGAGGSTISNMEITVSPLASFTVEDEENLISGTSVQFTNTSLGAMSYSWSFGDSANSTSTDENPTFNYDDEGTYTVTLTATSNAGSDTFELEINVAAEPIIEQLYFIDYSDELIGKLILDGSGTVSDVFNVAGMSGAYIAYDEVNEKVYWSNFANDYGLNSIWRMNLDGTNAEEVISNLNDPWGIAIDNTNGKIYWGDSDGTISKANLDGSNLELGFFSASGAEWTGISLDVENNKMYLYDYWIEDIYAVNMDGTNAQIIMSGVYGYSMFVDTVNNKLYFDEQNSDKLMMIDLDGTNPIEVNSALPTRTYGIAIDYENAKLYYSGRDTGELYKSDLDGSNLEVLKSGLTSPRGIFLLK